MNKTWTVVRFVEEDTVEAVPTAWIIGQQCHWPTYTNEKVVAAIRNYEPLNTCWPTHSISLFRNGTFESYIEARKRAKMAEYESDFSEDNKETRKNRKKVVVSSSEDEQIVSRIPNPPQRKSQNRKSDKAQEKVLLPSILGEIKLSSEVENVPQQDLAATPDIILDFQCGCCPVHNKFDIGQLSTISEDLKKVILENSKVITRKQNILTSLIYDLVSEVGKLSEEIKTMKIGVTDQVSREDYHSIFRSFEFPIDSVEKFNQFEEFVTDETNFTAFVNEIAKIGGSSPYEFIKRVFGGLLTNDIAVKYTWLGTKDKDALVKTKFASVLLYSSEKCCQTWDKKQTEEAIKKYLRRVKERLTAANKK